MLPGTTRPASRRRRTERCVEGRWLSAGCDASWFWCWDAPLTAALAGLAAVGCAAARWWWWSDAPFCGTRTWRSDAIMAAAFAAGLLAFRTIVAGREEVDPPSEREQEGKEGRYRCCLAAAAIAACIRLHHTELPWQGVLWPPDASGWRAYRVSASTHRHAEERSPGISGGEPLAGRLFVFDLVAVSGRSRYFSRARTIYQYLEEHRANYEVVAGFNSGMRAGGIVVYALSNWVPR